MVQIETKEALDEVDAIAAVPGIDVLFVGPFDLGNNIGRPIIGGEMHDDLQAAIKTILDAARKAGKKAGIFCTSGEQSKGTSTTSFPFLPTRPWEVRRPYFGYVSRTTSLSKAPADFSGYADMEFDMISCATDVVILQASVTTALYTAQGHGVAPKLTGPYGK